jgi:phosphoribosylamine--glycine ligase
VVTASAPTLADAAAAAYEAAELIEFDGRHFRRDIGAGVVRPSRI